VCWAGSQEEYDGSCPIDDVPGLSLVGDRSDLLSVRAPTPLLLIGAEDDPCSCSDDLIRTFEKLRATYTMLEGESRLRMEAFPFGKDYNRRMREASYAFFHRYLGDGKTRSYAPELRPLTDGRLNPTPSETVDRRSSELRVSETPLEGRTFRQRLERALAEPNPEPYDQLKRLIPWGKHGRVEHLEPGEVLLIHDETVETEPPGSKRLPFLRLDIELCHALGLSAAEFLAQVMHYRLPGRPEGWESTGLGGDAFTSIIASVKTLVEGANPPQNLKLLKAEGPVSSEVARILQIYRPELEVNVSHRWGSWNEHVQSGIVELTQPAARYLEFRPARVAT
jgi:hypothetical protein